MGANNEDEDAVAISAGCVLWTDSEGVKWCRDVKGEFGEPGSLSQLVGDEWHAIAESPGDELDADGCVYWTDDAGVRWCHDVRGAWGPAGAQYHSQDGSTWFGEGDAWVTLSEEAADFFSAAASRRARRSGASGGRGPSEKGAWQGRDDAGGETDFSAADVEAAALYGGFAQSVAALEAAVDAAFDEACRAARPVLWPELPLRL